MVTVKQPHKGCSKKKIEVHIQKSSYVYFITKKTCQKPAENYIQINAEKITEPNSNPVVCQEPIDQKNKRACKIRATEPG
jgi:hypothetical protein